MSRIPIDIFPHSTVNQCLDALETDIECFNDPTWYDEDGDGAECSVMMIDSIRAKLNALQLDTTLT